MKSKKLFAILTLVAFMMTLIPMAAFGASYSTAATLLSADKDSAKVNNNITFTIQFRDNTGKAITTALDNDIYVKASSDAVTAILTDGVTPTQDISAGVISAAGAPLAALDPMDDGTVTIALKSAVAGSVTLKLYKVPANTADVTPFASKTVEYVASESSASTVTATITDVEDGLLNSVGEEFDLKGFVADANGNGVNDVKVTFQKKVGSGGWETIGSAQTDALGYAKLNDISFDKADTYEFRAKYSSSIYDDVTGITLAAGAPATIETVVDEATVDVDAASASKVKFIIRDSLGNKIPTTGNLTVSLSSAPDDSDLDDANLAAVQWDSTDEYLYTTINPDVVGDYVVKGKITGFGASKNVTVHAKEVGDASKITLAMATDRVGLRAVDDGESQDTMALTVKVVDANGVSRDAESGEVKLATSSRSLATVADDSYVVTGNDSLNKGVVTITGTMLDTGLTATLDIPVTGGAASLNAVATVVDKTATVDLKLLDSNGNPVGADSFADFEYDGDNLAYDVVGVTATDVKNLDDKSGKGSFKFTSADYATKTVKVITDTGLATTLEVKFVAAPAPVAGAAKSVTMFIGAKGFVQDGAAKVADVAPFLKDNRTFVEVRALANAFGVTPENIKFENNVVTLVRSDMTVTIAIGGAVTKVVGGVSTPVASDVPAFITAEGRTVLPFRAVGEAFGYTVSYDAATQAVSYSL